jgi:hypothetical protein
MDETAGGSAILAALQWLEASGFGELLRGLGVWTYGLLNLGHIIGIAALFGAVLILDLRLLGAWRAIPVLVIARPTVPLAASGFVLAVITGVSMLSFNATEYHANPFLYLKLPLIVLGLINVAILQRLPAWQRAMADAAAAENDGTVLAAGGAISLAIWLVVVTCGRMIGYW